MPVGFWDDPDDARYRAAYFEHYPGVWRHGDWILFTERGSCVITGRSDATLNRGGVRMGTGEFYEVVEELDEVLDSLVVHLEDDEGGAGELLLFVVLARRRDARRRPARPDRRRRCAASSRRGTCPTRSRRCPAIPRTLTGKKLEAAGQADAARRRPGAGSPAATRSPTRARSTRSSAYARSRTPAG